MDRAFLRRRFKELKRQRRWSLRWLAEVTGLHRNTLRPVVVEGRVENERQRAYFRDILKAMGLSEEAFLWGDGAAPLAQPPARATVAASAQPAAIRTAPLKEVDAEHATDPGIESLLNAWRGANSQERAVLRWVAARCAGASPAPATDAPPAWRPLEDRPSYLNTRCELPRFTPRNGPARRGQRAARVPRWVNLAAGAGADLERCGEYRYYRELPDWKGFHSAVIRGDSMLDTLHPGDVVIMEELPEADRVLDTLAADDTKHSITRMRALVPPLTICVLSINDEAPTVKRVRYCTQKGERDWRMVITADNPHEADFPRPVGRDDQVTFWAKVVGIEGDERDR